jgi:tRNA G18 (ribose-2'-O)-methylase SpoU
MPPLAVDDPHDPRLDEYRNLTDPASRARLEAERSVMVVEGRLAVARMVAAGIEPVSLLVDDRQVVTSSDLVDAVEARGAPVYVGTREVVAATVGFSLHRGVVAVARRPDPLGPRTVLDRAAGTPSVGDGRPVVAVLEGLNDHENIGALFRNAAAFGVGGVLLDPTCADPLYRRSIRVSVGHALRIPFARLDPWPAALDLLRTAGWTVAALTPPPPDGPAVTVGDLGVRVGPGQPLALVVGAEGPGLSAAVLAAVDLVVSIPMAAGVDSLNVSTAAAVAFHAVTGP